MLPILLRDLCVLLFLCEGRSPVGTHGVTACRMITWEKNSSYSSAEGLQQFKVEEDLDSDI